MGGFGGALKNISIGIVSSNGKAYIHSAGKTANAAGIWSNYWNMPKKNRLRLSEVQACDNRIIDTT